MIDLTARRKELIEKTNPQQGYAVHRFNNSVEAILNALIVSLADASTESKGNYQNFLAFYDEARSLSSDYPLNFNLTLLEKVFTRLETTTNTTAPQATTPPRVQTPAQAQIPPR